MEQQAQNKPAEVGSRELREMGCGRLLGRYTLLRRIASGGMAEVYTARSEGISGFEKKVAIKKILPQHSHHERFIDMLVDEAKITVSLTHPNIAQVYELGLDGEDYFIVMEYVNGRPLNRLMQRVDERGLNTIPVEHAVHVMSEVAKGLDHAHARKDQRGNPLCIVHRDISPQNVLISYQGDVKLIDFGIARAEGRVNQTSAGVIKGKLRYLAPEIAAGEEPDGRADIYCAGIVLFEALTGEAMFAPRTDFEAIEMATEARVRSPRSRNPKVPKDLDDIVMHALTRDREDRYQTAKELYRDLRRFLNQHYPAFVGSELGDFIQNMFEPEIGEDERLDSLAEQIASNSGNSNATVEDTFEDEAPTIAGGPQSLLDVADLSNAPRYRQLVTRLGIGSRGEVKLVGADGGEAMEVIPADPADHPLVPRDYSGPVGATQPPRLEQYTQPPTDVDGARDAEPTVKAENPFAPSVVTNDVEVSDVDHVAIKGEPTVLDHAREDREDEQLVIARAKMRDVTDIRIQSGPPRRLLIGILAVIVGIGSLFYLLSGDTDPIKPVDGKTDTITLDPVPIKNDPIKNDPPKAPPSPYASLFIKVTPEVKVNIDIDGKSVAIGELPPVKITDIRAGKHRIVVRADGYKAKRFVKRLKRSDEVVLEANLIAATGTIRLKSLSKGAIVISSRGDFNADSARITNIPLNTEVEIQIDRPGAKQWVTNVHIQTTDTMNIYVPSPKWLPLGRGTLVVNARPMSTVWINGKKYGKTPVRAQLPARKHRVTLRSPSGKKKTFRRTVKKGKKVTFTHRWR